MIEHISISISICRRGPSIGGLVCQGVLSHTASRVCRVPQCCDCLENLGCVSLATSSPDCYACSPMGLIRCFIAANSSQPSCPAESRRTFNSPINPINSQPFRRTFSFTPTLSPGCLPSQQLPPGLFRILHRAFYSDTPSAFLRPRTALLSAIYILYFARLLRRCTVTYWSALMYLPILY